MNFNNIFRKVLQANLQVNKNLLGELSENIVKQSVNNCYRLILDDISSQYLPYYIDENSAIKCIQETINQKETPLLILRDSDDDNFRANEIKFRLIQKYHHQDIGEKAKNHRIQREFLEYKCEDEFWENNTNKQVYNEISIFECFEDLVKPISELKNWKYQFGNVFGCIYNIKDWVIYIQKLIEINFPEYIFNKQYSYGSIRRYLKPIGNSKLMFGFEYDNNAVKKTFKRDDAFLPYYFNLILINVDFNKKLSPKDYVYEYNDNILSLGIMGNPFFFPPCFPLLGYSTVARYMNPLTLGTFEHKLKYEVECVMLTEDTFQIKHPKEYGEKLKKHAFFYMQCLKYSSVGYLEYVEKSILDSIIVG